MLRVPAPSGAAALFRSSLCACNGVFFPDSWRNWSPGSSGRSRSQPIPAPCGGGSLVGRPPRASLPASRSLLAVGGRSGRGRASGLPAPRLLPRSPSCSRWSRGGLGWEEVRPGGCWVPPFSQAGFRKCASRLAAGWGPRAGSRGGSWTLKCSGSLRGAPGTLGDPRPADSCCPGCRDPGPGWAGPPAPHSARHSSGAHRSCELVPAPAAFCRSPWRPREGSAGRGGQKPTCKCLPPRGWTFSATALLLSEVSLLPLSPTFLYFFPSPFSLLPALGGPVSISPPGSPPRLTAPTALLSGLPRALPGSRPLLSQVLA